MVLQFLRGGRSQAPEKKASAAAPLITFHGAGRAAWSARDISTLTRSGFLNNPVGFRCVKLISEAAAAVPLVLQDDQRRYDVHPLLDLMSRPNAAQGQADLLEAFIHNFLYPPLANFNTNKESAVT